MALFVLGVLLLSGILFWFSWFTSRIENNFKCKTRNVHRRNTSFCLAENQLKNQLMKKIGIMAAVVLSTLAFAGCGNSQGETEAESNGVPTQMGTDADSTATPYMDTTAAPDGVDPTQ